MTIEVSVFSDHQQCSPGWYRGGRFCYLINTEKKFTWFRSKVECRDRLATLAMFSSIEEFETMRSIIPTISNNVPVLHVGFRYQDAYLQWLDGRYLNKIEFKNASDFKGYAEGGGIIVTSTGERILTNYERSRIGGYVCQLEHGNFIS